MQKLDKPYTSKQKSDFIVEYNHRLGLRIEETETALYALNPYEKLEGDEVIEDRETWEQEQKKEEYDRIQELFITKSDFFDNTIKAFGADGDDLLLVVNKLLPTLQIDDVSKKIALNNFKNAQNFYRKHTLFTLLSDVDIPITEDKSIRITSEQWDNFFDKATNINTKADAYKELLPIEE